MLIVSDTSPITNLIQIGELDILKEIFDQVIIPQKVFEELSVYEHQEKKIRDQSWIQVRSVQNTSDVKELLELLDEGEAEAIVLAKELKADFLIIDERKGRKIAQENGLQVVGLIGVLIKAKQKGIINKLRPLLTLLINDAGFRISQNLLDRILRETDEL